MTPDLARLTEEERAIAARLGPRVCPLDGHVSREDRGRVDSAELLILLMRLASARTVVEAARRRLVLEGHEQFCSFSGCSCGRYDEAKAARQDVQRALAAHDAAVKS